MSRIVAQGPKDEKPAALQFSPLVLLKPGTKAPVFIASGIGADVMELSELAKSVRSSNAIYGMQVRGLDGVDEPFGRIEDMAECYLRAIKELQARGPYHLIGYSAGGLVALEIALRLSEGDESVALLVLLDTYPYFAHWPLGARIRIVARLALHHASVLMRLPIRQAGGYVAHRSRGLIQHLWPGRVRRLSHPAPTGVSSATVAARVRNSSDAAWERYQPRHYNGKIRFVRAAIASRFPDDPRVVWGKHATEFEVETVPGDHLEMVQIHFETVASVLSRYHGELPGRE